MQTWHWVALQQNLVIKIDHNFARLINNSWQEHSQQQPPPKTTNIGPVQTKPNIKTPNKTKLQSQAKLKSSSSSILNCNAMDYGTWNAIFFSFSSSSSSSSSFFLYLLTSVDLDDTCPKDRNSWMNIGIQKLGFIFIYFCFFHFVKLKNSFLPLICDHMGCIKLGKKLFYYFLLSTDWVCEWVSVWVTGERVGQRGEASDSLLLLLLLLP